MSTTYTANITAPTGETIEVEEVGPGRWEPTGTLPSNMTQFYIDKTSPQATMVAGSTDATSPYWPLRVAIQQGSNTTIQGLYIGTMTANVT